MNRKMTKYTTEFKTKIVLEVLNKVMALFNGKKRKYIQIKFSLAKIDFYNFS